jgi:hypothetical protein
MSPQSKQSSATDASGNAQGRFTVQLPASLRPKVDALIRAQSDAIVKAGGFPMEVSGAQVVGAVIEGAYASLEAREAAARRAEREATEASA